MVGNPKYKVGDIVKFWSFLFSDNDKRELTGTVAIVDDYGTFFDNSDASYDILVKEDGVKVLCKHIREDRIIEKTGEYDGSVWDM